MNELEARTDHVLIPVQEGWRSFVGPATWAVVLAPTSVVLHEIGHLIVATYFDFPDVEFHFSSVTSGAEAAGFPALQLALEAAGGPVATVLLLATSCALVEVPTVRTPAIVLGLVAPLRFAAGALFVLVTAGGRLVGVRPSNPYFDEFVMGTGLGLPVSLIVLTEVAATALVWRRLARRAGRGRFSRIAVGAAIGSVLGLTVWATIVGPRLLP